MITQEQIREKLAQEIKYSGHSQTKIAQILGIKQQTISEYMKGKSMPSIETFANLCYILDLDANEILCLNQKYPLNINQTNNQGTINNNF